MRDFIKFWLLAFAFGHECRYGSSIQCWYDSSFKVMKHLASSVWIPVCQTMTTVKRRVMGVQAVNSTVESI